MCLIASPRRRRFHYSSSEQISKRDIGNVRMRRLFKDEVDVILKGARSTDEKRSGVQGHRPGGYVAVRHPAA